MLEPCEGKLSCTVLRGESGSNTADLLDQMLEIKQKFISQIMTGKSSVRSCEDVDKVALTYAEIKALSMVLFGKLNDAFSVTLNVAILC